MTTEIIPDTVDESEIVFYIYSVFFSKHTLEFMFESLFCSFIEMMIGGECEFRFR